MKTSSSSVRASLVYRHVHPASLWPPLQEGVVEYRHVHPVSLWPLQEGVVEYRALPVRAEGEQRSGQLARMFTHSLRAFRRRHRWMAFFDADEFLVIKDPAVPNLPALLKRYEGEAPYARHFMRYEGEAPYARHFMRYEGEAALCTTLYVLRSKALSARRCVQLCTPMAKDALRRTSYAPLRRHTAHNARCFMRYEGEARCSRRRIRFKSGALF